MASLLIEWFSLLARWAHIIAAIMWIGDSLLFMWIDSHLAPDPQSRRDVTGVAWLIHGGGYYHLEKRLLVPGQLPPTLRWFWLEATGTWLSGVLLLILVYYMSADAFMVDRGVSTLTPGAAIAVGLGLLAGGWILYDGLWRTRLSQRPLAALLVSGTLLIGVIYGATHTLSARAAKSSSFACSKRLRSPSGVHIGKRCAWSKATASASIAAAASQNSRKNAAPRA